jgi:anti-anti-sigma factor
MSESPGADVQARTHEGAVHITLSGEIDLANVVSTENKLLDAITDETTSASVDLSNIDYIDSTGVRILFTLATRLRVLHIPLVFIAALDSPARQIVALSGLPSVAPLQSP